MKCKKCGHKLVKHINPKNKAVKYLHHNRSYFGCLAINHTWCSMCEVIMNQRKKFVVGDICNKPQPFRRRPDK